MKLYRSLLGLSLGLFASTAALAQSTDPDLIPMTQLCIEHAEKTGRGNLFADDGTPFDAVAVMRPFVDESRNLDCRSNSFMYPFYPKEGFKMEGKETGVWIGNTQVDKILNGDGWTPINDAEQVKADDLLVLRNARGAVLLVMIVTQNSPYKNDPSKRIMEFSAKVDLKTPVLVTKEIPLLELETGTTTEFWTPRK